MQRWMIYQDGDLPAITVSIGVAAGEQGIDAIPLLSKTDAALHLAKESGRNRVAIASAD